MRTVLLNKVSVCLKLLLFFVLYFPVYDLHAAVNIADIDNTGKVDMFDVGGCGCFVDADMPPTGALPPDGAILHAAPPQRPPDAV